MQTAMTASSQPNLIVGEIFSALNFKEILSLAISSVLPGTSAATT
jgi:hypothetical protein